MLCVGRVDSGKEPSKSLILTRPRYRSISSDPIHSSSSNTHISISFNFSSLILSVIFFHFFSFPTMLIPSFMLHPTLFEKMMKIHLSKHYYDSRAYLCLMELEARKRGNYEMRICKESQERYWRAAQRRHPH